MTGARRRVDPRAVLAARAVAGKGRPRLVLAPAAAVGGKRRDPRAVLAAALVRARPRRRYDWTQEAPPAVPTAAPATPAAAPEPPLRIIPAPAFLVLAVLDRPGGDLTDHDRQVVAAARRLADPGGGAVVTVATGPEDGLAAAGADRHVALPDAWAADYCPEARAAAVTALLADLAPRHALFPETADGGDVARRVAAMAGERLWAGAESVSAGQVARRARGGTAELRHAPPRLITVAADAVAPLAGVRHEARPLEATLPRSMPRLTGPRRLAVDADALPLAEADLVVSAGNGVTDWSGFAAVARALGGTRAGSRVVCDAGHLPRDRQVGASGTVVTARSYLAFGIAGAPQHLQGIAGVGHVIAVNTDLHAEMIKRADLAVVADAQAVMPALLRLLEEEGRHG
ncbi:electron transfer flavoprotein subunit alpha/FixB family protein [Azospirillum sp. ST 5-10]|uniref:electron transfer flavoprotein subunit alpha/FixB family protein n=1 Tax=unclassified Azospirillum TaxID=2630922 RepID=UPI003F49B6CA